MSSESEDEQLDLNDLDFNDPMVIQTLRMTMMEIMENEHTENPLQQSRSRTMLRGTHTIRSVSYPYRKHSKSRVDTTRGCTLPMLEEQPEEELRQMGEPLLGNYLLDYARRRVYICLSTPIVRNNYYIFKQAMHKNLRLNDRSADKLRRIWDEARVAYHKRLIRESGPVTQRAHVAPKSRTLTRSTTIRPVTAGHMQSRIPTLRSKSDRAKMRTKRTKSRTSIVDVNVPTKTAIEKSSETKPPSRIGSRIFDSKLYDKVQSDFWYDEYRSPKATSSTVGNTIETSIGDEKANSSSSPEPAQMNSEEQENNDSNSSSQSQRDDICQGLTKLQLNEPTPSGSKKKQSEASIPSGSAIQRDYGKYVVKGDGSSDGMENLFIDLNLKPKSKKSVSSSTISTDPDIRYIKREDGFFRYIKREDAECSDSGNAAERRQSSEQHLQPPTRVTSKTVRDGEKKSSDLLYLEDIYHYPHCPKRNLTDEQYEKRVYQARQGRQFRQSMQNVEKGRKLFQEHLIQAWNFDPRQTTSNQKATVPRERLFLGEIEYPTPFEQYNLRIQQPQIVPYCITTCEYCQMFFFGLLPITQMAPQAFKNQNADEKPKKHRRKVEPDPFLMSPARRRQIRVEMEEEQKRKIQVQRKRAREARELHEKQGKKDYWGFQTRQLSPNKEFNKLSEAEGVTHMVSPPRSIMRPSWFPERMPYHHQPHHIKSPPPRMTCKLTCVNDELVSSDDEEEKIKKFTRWK